MVKKILLFIVILGLGIFFFKYFQKSNSSDSSSSSPSSTRSSKDQNKSLTIKGSDTEVQLVSTLAETFNKTNPGNDISVTGGGSGVGIAALFNKEIDLANSSRAMTDQELQQAKDKKIEISQFVLARDGVTVIVHPDNKITLLTLEQLGDIYRGKTTNWKNVGGDDKPITLYGRQSTSGTYAFFRDTVLKDDYSQQMKTMEGNQTIAEAVKADKSGIGYVGVGYAKDEDGNPRKDLKVILISKDETSEAISPLDVKAVQDGKYPIFRAIYQYLPFTPTKDSLAAAFLKFESSEEGQKIIEKAGFYPLTAQDKDLNTKLFDSMK